MEIRFECLPLQAKPSIYSMMMGTKLAKIMYTFAKNIYWQKTSFVHWVACNGFVYCWSLQPLLFCFVFTCNMWSNAMITWSFVEGYYHLLQYKRFTLTYRNLWQSNWRVSLTHWHIKRQKCERARERESKKWERITTQTLSALISFSYPAVAEQFQMAEKVAEAQRKRLHIKTPKHLAAWNFHTHTRMWRVFSMFSSLFAWALKSLFS